MPVPERRDDKAAEGHGDEHHQALPGETAPRSRLAIRRGYGREGAAEKKNESRRAGETFADAAPDSPRASPRRRARFLGERAELGRPQVERKRHGPSDRLDRAFGMAQVDRAR